MVEYKGLKSKTIKNFVKYIVLSNHNVSLHVKMDDGYIICLDISPYYKENIEYFKCLEKILNNQNTSSIFMNYLFKHDFLD